MIVQSDVLITVWVMYTDTITADFTQQIDSAKTIDVGLYHSRIGDQTFDLPMATALEVLNQLAHEHGAGWQRAIVAPPQIEEDSSDNLPQNSFWPLIQAFLRPGDIILADRGTAAFGAASLRLLPDARLLVQPLWGAIGYTLPAAFGAQTAEPASRVVLIIGDGSVQLKAQEIGSMLRDGQKPVIFMLNNDGYRRACDARRRVAL